MLFLESLQNLEQETNSLILAFQSDLHVIAIVLNHLNFIKVLTKSLDYSKNASLDKDLISQHLLGELLILILLDSVYLVHSLS